MIMDTWGKDYKIFSLNYDSSQLLYRFGKRGGGEGEGFDDYGNSWLF